MENERMKRNETKKEKKSQDNRLFIKSSISVPSHSVYPALTSASDIQTHHRTSRISLHTAYVQTAGILLGSEEGTEQKLQKEGHKRS